MRISKMIVPHCAAVNSPGLRAIWQRLQFIVHSSAPDRGSAFTEVTSVVVFFLVSELDAGVCAVAAKAMVTTAAQVVAMAKRRIDLTEPQRGALVFLEVCIVMSLESVGDLKEEPFVRQAIGAVIARKFVVAFEPECIRDVVDCTESTAFRPRPHSVVNCVVAAY